MIVNKKINDFEIFWNNLRTILIAVPSTSIVFNQYRDYNDQVDLPNASNIRIMNLYNYLTSYIKTTKYLLIGEAAGPWGCRFSGIPFTGERQLLDPTFPVQGLRSSLISSTLSLSKIPPFISKSATTFWDIMLPFHNQFIVWDAFPLHPHKENQILTVRNPTRREVSQFSEALLLLKTYMNPIQIVAIGMMAFEQLKTLGIESIYVRHPSRGGTNRFISGIHGIFAS